MAGTTYVTFEELGQVKFTVVEHFGITRKKGCRTKFKFFIMNTLPPTKYGADCKDYTWYEVQLNTEQDFEQLNSYLKNLFNMDSINIPSGKDSMCSIKLLEKQIGKKGKVIDWGACHVTYLPIAAEFQKLYVC